MGLIARVCGLRGVTRGLREEEMPADPMPLFAAWFRFARRTRIYWPDAAALATADAAGAPSVRMVLLKQFDPGGGFVFFTNYTSRKGRELDANPRASMVLYWNDLVRQIRMTGPVERIARAESEAYFHSRPRGSQIGAWASDQDTVMPSRQALMDKFADFEQRFAGGPVPLPDQWGGYRLRAEEIEFWQGRTYRLHDRFLYTRSAEGGWTRVRLSP